ncbi:hypothetical protein GW17_00041777 [Ensete ventricosum]|nr:hypothetical protein GW17_00041777 [Ensete ventricosum]
MIKERRRPSSPGRKCIASRTASAAAWLLLLLLLGNKHPVTHASKRVRGDGGLPQVFEETARSKRRLT